MKKLKLISLILAVVMLASMLPFGAMISAFAAEGDQPVADEDWYLRETTDEDPDVLEINNVNEFFAFAEKLDEGTADTPAFTRVDPDTGALIPLTVKLNTNIVLNDGWDAINVTKAEDVKEPAVEYPVSASSFFGGTFDGNGYILSGLYTILATGGITFAASLPLICVNATVVLIRAFISPPLLLAIRSSTQPKHHILANIMR